MTGIPVQLVGEGIDWPAWFQAVGSVVGIAIAIAIPAWQRYAAGQDAKLAEVARIKNARELAQKLASIAIARLKANRAATEQAPTGAGMIILIRTTEADLAVLDEFNLHDLQTGRQMQAFAIIRGLLLTSIDGLKDAQRFEANAARHAAALKGLGEALTSLIDSCEVMAEALNAG